MIHQRIRSITLISMIFCLLNISGTAHAGDLEGDANMIIIAHRGASGKLPEHTLEGYRSAVLAGADFIEPDIVFTKDGVAVARHDIYLSGSTDVAAHPEFADRKRTFEEREDWFVFDFTLAEIKSLRAVQPRPGRSKALDGLYEIPTLEEIIALVADYAGKGHIVGLYPELKRPALFAAKAIDPAGDLLAHLAALDAKVSGIPVYIQSFDYVYLGQLPGKSRYPLIALVDSLYDDDGRMTHVPEMGLDELRQFDGVGINKGLLITAEGKSSGYVQRAHALGLKVHVWTVRDDDLPAQFSSVGEELAAIRAMGADGIFTDFPGSAHQYLR